MSTQLCHAAKKRFYGGALQLNKRHCDRLEEADLVCLHCAQYKKGVSPKLTCQWQGPYLVTKRLTLPIGYNRSRRQIAEGWKYTGEILPTCFPGSPPRDAEEATVDDNQELNKPPELRRGGFLRPQPD